MSAKKIATTSLLALFAFITPKVNAHGFPERVIVDGRDEEGLQSDWRKPDQTAVLVSDYLLPHYNVWASEIACGKGARAPTRTASVGPGSTLQWRWMTHDDDTNQPQKTWTHHEGTHRAFIGPCIGSCLTTNPNDVEWTELGADLVGQQTWNGQRWPVQDIDNGGTWSVRIPNVPSGDYLIRDELTALHFSTGTYQDYDPGTQHGSGTEFYPGCIAITVNNGGGGSFDLGRAMKFPGAYNTDAPGHYNPDLWANPSSVVLASTNTFARTNWPAGGSGGSGGSGGGSSGGDNGGNGGSSGGDNGGNGGGNGTTPGNNGPGTGQGCSARRKRRSVKFRRSHHAMGSH